MSAVENKKLLRGIFDQMARGNTSALSGAMAEDVRWVFPGNWSWSGTWEPRRVVIDELLRPLMAQFDSYRSEADLILADGDRVIVQARSFATTKRGDPYHQTYCYIFRVRGGRLTEVVEHCDSALVERVLESPAPAPVIPGRRPGSSCVSAVDTPGDEASGPGEPYGLRS
jgi:uncharacterized protein